MSTAYSILRIDPAAPVPLAAQVSQQLAWLIATGELTPGDQLPPVRQLAHDLGINLHTVRAAYAQLAANGLVRAGRGRRATVLEYDLAATAAAASSLPSFTLGVIIPDFALFYAPMLDGIEAAAARHPALTVICSAREDPGAALRYLNLLVARGVDGIIVVSPLLPAELPLALLGQDPPMVFIDYPDAPGPGVEFDLEGSATQATRHLIEHGHRRIGYLTPPLEWPNVAPKHAGYQAALRSSGLQPDRGLVAAGADFAMETGRELTEYLLDQEEPPTGIVAASDRLALGAMRAVVARRLEIPDDIALISIDDSEMAGNVRPPLSSVALPGYEAGVRAAGLLHELILGRSPASPIVLESSLVVRQSCGCTPDPSGPVES